ATWQGGRGLSTRQGANGTQDRERAGQGETLPGRAGRGVAREGREGNGTGGGESELRGRAGHAPGEQARDGGRGRRGQGRRNRKAPDGRADCQGPGVAQRRTVRPRPSPSW